MACVQVFFNVWIGAHKRKCANWERQWRLLLSVFTFTKQKSLIMTICSVLAQSAKIGPYNFPSEFLHHFWLYLNKVHVAILHFEIRWHSNKRKSLSFLQSSCLLRLAEKFIYMLYSVVVVAVAAVRWMVSKDKGQSLMWLASKSGKRDWKGMKVKKG